jgi:hypothetical protein
MGQTTPYNPHPKDGAIFWTGSGICENRVLNITKKRGLDGNITNCLKINKRQAWVNHLVLEQSQLTSSGRYSEKRANKIEKNAQKPKTIGKCGFEASIHRNNHKSQQKLEKTKEGKVHDREILLSNVITISHHLPKTIRPNRLFCNSYVEPYCNPQLEQVEIQKCVEST